MKTITADVITAAVEDLCIRAAHTLPVDVFDALKNAAQQEQSPEGRASLIQCIANAEIAAKGMLPICQDTGSAVLFVELGAAVVITGGCITDAIQRGCRNGYLKGYLRASIVNDPLFDRTNTNDNTPAVIHYDIVPGDCCTITLLPKGGGCENMSVLAMLKPADGKEAIIDFVTAAVKNAGGNPCPPVTVGVGIGGTADKASFLAKKALVRPIGTVHQDKRYAQLERELYASINNTGNGPQGLGGLVTALAVHIECFPCHIASLPVAVNLNCHAARRATVTLSGDV